jgi:hypothetical protein
MLNKHIGTMLVLGVAMAFVVSLGASSASADSLTFDLGTGNSAISGFLGPYAHVAVNRTDTTHATVTFTSLTNSGNIYLLGDGGSVGVNVNATSWTLGTITGSNAGTGFTPGPYSNGGAGNEDGFGSFNQRINSFDGYTHSSDTISFTLTDTSGLWLSASNVLIGNGSGNTAAAHIFVTSSPANGANGALATGFASNGAVSTPEASSTLLLSLALLGVVAVSRKLVPARG